MKKWVLISLSVMLFCMSACGNLEGDNETVAEYNGDSADGISITADSSDIADRDEEEDIVDAANRTMIAGALGIEESSRNIRFIINSLHTIGAGQILSAEAAEADGEKVINLVAEDGTNYRVYLSGSGSVEAIKNMDTGEWPVQSQR